jgi:hypothetical protein
MTKRKRQKTIQWPKGKDRRQYNDQKKKTEDNTMAITFYNNIEKKKEKKHFLNYIIYWVITVQNCHIRGGNSTMEKMFTKENS